MFELGWLRDPCQQIFYYLKMTICYNLYTHCKAVSIQANLFIINKISDKSMNSLVCVQEFWRERYGEIND